jgi:hypothetical protein
MRDKNGKRRIVDHQVVCRDVTATEATLASAEIPTLAPSRGTDPFAAPRFTRALKSLRAASAV